MGLCADAVASSNTATLAKAGHNTFARGNTCADAVANTIAEEITRIQNATTRESAKKQA